MSYTINMYDFKKIKTVGDFLHHLKIGRDSWVVIEVTEGFVVNYVFEGSPFKVRTMTLITPNDERHRIFIKTLYRD